MILRIALLTVISMIVQTATSPGLFANDSSSDLFSLQIAQIETQNFPQILLYLLVNDPHGIVKDSLTSEDIFISEQRSNQNEPIAVKNISLRKSAGDQKAVSVALIFDSSGSMWGKQKDIKRATTALVKTLSSNDRASIIFFSTRSHVVQPFLGKTIDLNHNQQPDLIEAIDTYQSGGKSALYDALDMGIDLLNGEHGIKAIVIFADGEDNSSKTSQKLVIAKALKAQIPIFTIGLGLKLDPLPLESIASETGGRYFSAPDVKKINKIYQEFFRSVSSQYEIAYTSPSSNLDGTSRRITLGLKGERRQQTRSGKSYSTIKPFEIKRDKKTIGLSQPPYQHPLGTPLKISVGVKDAEKMVQLKIRLFYRLIGSGSSYEQLDLVLDPISGQFTGVIHESFVVNPGIEYYILAANGQTTTTSPKEGTTTGQTYQIAVDPNYAPVLAHFPPRKILRRDVLNVKVKTIDDTDYISAVKVFYRRAGWFHYVEHVMTAQKNGFYVADIPLTQLTVSGIEYYISAWDNHGVRGDAGTALKPFLVKPIGPKLLMGPETQALSQAGYVHDPVQPLQITLQLENETAPEQIRATLFYRRAKKANAFSRLDMVYSPEAEHFKAIIPSEKLKGRVLEYYISATDGVFSQVLPAQASGQFKVSRIKLGQRISPLLQHQPLPVLLIGEQNIITVEINLLHSNIVSALFSYKNPAQSQFGQLPLIHQSKSLYQKHIPVSSFGLNGLQYFLTIEDNQGKQYHHGTSDAPHHAAAVEMVYIKGACFQMGDEHGLGSEVELPLHEVCLDDFYLAKHETTQLLWQSVQDELNPAYNQSQETNPSENVSWDDVQTFLSRLNRLSNQTFQLPTEAEWEYACRSGLKMVYASRHSSKSSKAISNDLANFDGKKGQDLWNGSAPVGSFPVNPFGIHDMSGNVWEWVQDSFSQDYYAKSPRSNPLNKTPGADRIIRGGSWFDGVQALRCSNRSFLPAAYKSRFIGFRLKMVR